VYRHNKPVKVYTIGRKSTYVGRAGRGLMWVPIELDGSTEKVSGSLSPHALKRIQHSRRKRLPRPHFGSASGHTTNVVSGLPVQRARLMIRNTKTRAVKVVYTDRFGKYVAARLPIGHYKVTIVKHGFSRNVEHLIIQGARNMEKAMLLSPKLRAGEMRFVLTWENLPRDLDSYLQTPRGCTIYYRKKSCVGAQFNLDDVKRGGPETITVHRFRRGFYYYYIRQFSKLGRLENSGAKVRVFSGNSNSFNTYKLGSYGKLKGQHGRGRTWLVLKISGSTGRQVNGAKIKVKVGAAVHARRRRSAWTRRRRVRGRI